MLKIEKFILLAVVAALALSVPPCLAQADLLPGSITALTFSPDGKHLAVGTYGQALVYDTATWQTTGNCTQMEDYARALVYTPDGQRIAIGSGTPGKSGRLTFWDPTANSAKRLLARQFDTVESLAYNSSGKQLLMASKDKKALLFPVLPDEQQIQMDEHNGRVQAVAFSPKENFIFITGGLDRIVKVWDARYRKTVVNFDQSEGGITGLAFLDDNHFVGSGLDGRLNWWQVTYNERRVTWRGDHYRRIDAHEGGVFAMAMSADRKRLITGGADKRVCVWDRDGNRQKEFKEVQHPVYAVALSPDGKIATAGSSDGKVYVWEVESSKLLQTLTPPALPEPPKPATPPAKIAAKPATNTAKNAAVSASKSAIQAVETKKPVKRP